MGIAIRIEWQLSVLGFIELVCKLPKERDCILQKGYIMLLLIELENGSIIYTAKAAARCRTLKSFLVEKYIPAFVLHGTVNGLLFLLCLSNSSVPRARTFGIECKKQNRENLDAFYICWFLMTCPESRLEMNLVVI